MKVSIVGAGYVGLVTGACLAAKGHQVVCVDMDEEKVNRINQAIPIIHENGLRELLVENVGVRLKASTALHKCVLETDITLIAVGTPFNGNEIDLTFVRKVAIEIGRALKEKTYHVIAVKSTVVPGTTDDIVLPLLEEASGKTSGVDFGLGVNPEFLTEGEAIQDFMFPDRIILGGIDRKTVQVLEDLYSGFGEVDVLTTNNKTAEMIKYTSNALLATMISFSNEFANLCAALGDIDIVDVMRGIHSSKYLSVVLPDGSRKQPSIISFLWAGCGFGGSCLPKDVKALIAHGQRVNMPMPLLSAVIKTNDSQHQQILSILKKHFTTLEGISVAVLGLSFRPDTDDMRESPAIPIVRELLASGARVKAYDPVANHNARKCFNDKNVSICDDLFAAVTGVQVIILATSWSDFAQVPELVRALDPQPLLIDGRRMFDSHSVSKYAGIGLN